MDAVAVTTHEPHLDLHHFSFNTVKDEFIGILNNAETPVFIHKTYPVLDPLVSIGGAVVKLPIDEETLLTLKNTDRKVSEEKIQFGNAEWSPFITKTIDDVYAQMGIEKGVHNPSCRLIRIDVRLPGLCTEKLSLVSVSLNGPSPDGGVCFASAEVILSSAYTGGIAKISWNGKEVGSDGGFSSGVAVLAWSSDAHWVTEDPVKSGHRVSFTYELSHPYCSPALPAEKRLRNSFEDLFASWRAHLVMDAQPYPGPYKLVHILPPKPDEQILSYQALLGLSRMQALKSAASAHGFCVGFGSLIYMIEGTGPVYASYHAPYYGPLTEIVEQQISIVGVKDIDNSAELCWHNSKTCSQEIIAKDYQEILMKGLPNTTRHLSGLTYERRYNPSCQVLLLWSHPHYSHLKYDKGYAYQTHYTTLTNSIKSIVTSRPTISEQKKMDMIFRAFELGRYETKDFEPVCVSIADVACNKWGDSELWCRAVNLLPANRALDAISQTNLLAAVKKFGLDNILSTCVLSVFLEYANESNLDRLTVLDKIAELAGQDPPQKVLDWIDARRKAIASSLQTPVGSKEIIPLIDLAKKCGGLTCLDKVMVPRLLPIASPRFLAKFARYLAFTNDLFPETADTQITDRLVTDLLTAAISRINFFEKVPYKSGMNRYSYANKWIFYGHPILTHEIAQFMVVLCIKTYNHQLVDKIVDRLVETHSLESTVVHARIIYVLLPFILIVCRKPPQTGYSIASTDTIPDSLKRLCRETLILFCTHAPPDYTPREHDLPALCEAIICSAAQDLLRTHLAPKLQEIKGMAFSHWISLVDLIHKNRHRVTMPPGVSFSPAITTIIDQLIAKISIKPAETTHTKITSLIELVLQTDNLPSCTKLFTHIIPPDDASIGPLFIRNVLAKVVPKMAQLLQKRQFDLAAEPFGPVFRRIICLYTDKVLGPKRATRGPEKRSIEGIKEYSCRRGECDLCAQLVKALVSNPEGEIILDQTGAAGCGHILSILKKPIFRLSGLPVATGESNRGYGRKTNTKINKTEAFRDAVVWSCDRDTALALLKSISEDDEVLKTILDSDYDRIIQHLAEPEVVDEPAPFQAKRPPPRPRKKRARPVKEAFGSSGEDQGVVNTGPRQTRAHKPGQTAPSAGQELDTDASDEPPEEPQTKKRRLESLNEEMDVS
ncbi:hypothetical protein H0H81_010563 [Sphagnurus paluster]|uniref:Uncharacterized protein n=1 Tax=Sphagnurus paluster TaxID=117069 RepID=A0A9P7GJ24_9AGAR|nr:hypothetical protein H0H81_010563 [Sphagnurus paluster]